MSYTDTLRPPVSAGKLSLAESNSTSLGNSQNESDYNPWPSIIEAVQQTRTKTLRTLIFSFQNRGDKAPGTAVGAFRCNSGTETHTNGAGTIFLKVAALMIMDN